MMFVSRYPGITSSVFVSSKKATVQENIMNKYVDSLGLSDTQVYRTNMVMCSTRSSSDLLLEHVLSCWLWKSLEMFTIGGTPKVIFPMCYESMEFYLGINMSPSKVLGTIFQVSSPQGLYVVVPINHPTMSMRDSRDLADTLKVLEAIRILNVM